MENVILKTEEILDCKKSWKDILFNEGEDINIFKSRRIKDFVNTAYPTKELKKNIDLSTLLILLKHRNCFINIPEYKNTTIAKDKSNVKLKDSKDNKIRGKIISLKSNQNTFNFSVTIADERYVEHKIDGNINFAPRTYTLTDVNGDLQDNWDNFSFQITDKELEYFKSNLDIDMLIPVNKFVNEQLAQAMYTMNYYNMKLFIDRLVAERKYLKDIKNEFLPKCKTVSIKEYDTDPKTTITESKDNYKSVKVLCFETKPSISPDFEFDYINKKLKPETIVKKCDELMDGLIDMTGEYKFYCRLIELAFTKMNPYKEGMTSKDFHTYNDRFECKWNEQTVKYPRSKIEWFELMHKKCSLVCRYYYKSIQQKIK